MASVGTTYVAKESFHPGELPEHFPSTSSQLGNISTFNNLPLGVDADIIVMVVGDIAPTQVEELLMGTGVENIPSTSNHASIVVIETGSGSTLPVPTPAMAFWKSCLSNDQAILHNNGVLY